MSDRVAPSKGAWTPGPWKYSRDHGVTTRGRQRLLVTGVAQPLGNHPDAEEAEANALLISKSPQMAELLREIRSGLWCDCGSKADDPTQHTCLRGKAESLLTELEGKL